MEKAVDLAWILTPPGIEQYSTLSLFSGCSLGFISIHAPKAAIRKIDWKTILVVVIKFRIPKTTD